jgi:Calx-beta domain
VKALSIAHRCCCVMVTVAGMLALAGCGDPARVAAPPVVRGEPNRIWTFGEREPNQTLVRNGDRQEQQGGVVDDVREFGNILGAPAGNATARVLSSADGTTYAVSTEAQNSVVTLTQTQQFRKVARNAFLRFVITRAEMRGGIFNNFGPSRDCVDLGIGCITEAAGVSLEIKGWRDGIPLGGSRTFVQKFSKALLSRDANRWFFDSDAESMDGADFLWLNGSFVQAFTPGQDARLASVTLSQSRVVRIDLAELDTGETFTIRTTAIAETYKRGGGGETFTHAYLRDPAGVGGTNVEFEGLEQMSTPTPEPTEPAFGEAPQCTVPNAAAGSLQFSRAAYRRDEISISGRQPVTVTRTGGSSGQVSATVTTSDGTAIVGADYTAVIGTVSFLDGDTERADHPRHDRRA